MDRAETPPYKGKQQGFYTLKRTTFFQNCSGVFQGGGCRAAALAGAYAEAVSRGVRLGEVAGTSAGSIIAALIGAGASPEKLKEIIRELDFTQFLIPPEKVIKSKWSYLFLLPRIGPVGEILQIAINQGQHSSAQIEVWMEQKLGELLPNATEPIQFQDLLIPTSVVATDLVRGRLQVWSQTSSADYGVAKAVRASCSIPFFFQPADNRYVDGGVLSNLPAFVYHNTSVDERPISNRILAFTLKADPELLEITSIINLLKALANTVVDGNQDLQINTQGEVHVISIPTGKIRATDFKTMDAGKVDRLIQSGSTAAGTFFDRELSIVLAPRSANSICYGKDEMYTAIVESLEQENDEVFISEVDTGWVYSIFPTLLCWCLRGAKIQIILPKLADAANATSHEAYQRRLLKSMGVHVYEVDATLSRNYLFNPRNPDRSSAVVGLLSSADAANIQSEQAIEGVKYAGRLDQRAILAIHQQLLALCSAQTVQEAPFKPKWQEGGQEELLRNLRSGVSQYAGGEVHLAVETIPLSSIDTLVKAIREYKYKQIEHLLALYKEHNIDIFTPCHVELRSNQSSLVTPPVVEESGGRFILIEGSTRATYCLHHGVEAIACVVVRGTKVPLPSEVMDLRATQIVRRTLGPQDRYKRFFYGNFRSIEKAVHKLDSLNL